MNKLAKATVLLGITVLAACTKPGIKDGLVQDDRININNNQSQLSERIHLRNEQVNLGALKSIDPVTLTLVAEVDPPMVNGQPTVATHVEFDGDKAYVTYHTFGEGYGGAVEVFDVSDPDNPLLISSITITDTDFHNLDIEGSELWAGGARDIYSSGYTALGTKGAIVQRYSLGSGLFLGPPDVEKPLSSFATTSISKGSIGVIASTGDVDGHSYLLDPTTLDVVDLAAEGDVKYICQGATYYAAVVGDGATSKLVIYHTAAFSVTSKMTVPLAGDVTTVGKNAVKCYDDHVLVALGDEGVYKVDVNTGAILASFNNAGMGDGIAISAVEIGDYTYVAYGCDGIIILDSDYNKIAEYKMGTNGSANYVETNGDVIFVASGNEGLRILRNTSVTCDLEHAPDGSIERAFWFELYYPSTSRHQAFVWETGTGDFEQNPDGTAQVKGVIVNRNDPTDKWEITINLAEKKNWAQWSALGRDYMAGPGYVPGSHEDWFYYIMDPNPGNPSTMEGLGSNVGTTKVLAHKPSGLRFGFQLGYGANVKSGDYGLGGWFYYENSAGDSRTGDINVNVTGC